MIRKRDLAAPFFAAIVIGTATFALIFLMVWLTNMMAQRMLDAALFTNDEFVGLLKTFSIVYLVTFVAPLFACGIGYRFGKETKNPNGKDDFMAR